jgi:hypothetical protein
VRYAAAAPTRAPAGKERMSVSQGPVAGPFLVVSARAGDCPLRGPGGLADPVVRCYRRMRHGWLEAL